MQLLFGLMQPQSFFRTPELHILVITSVLIFQGLQSQPGLPLLQQYRQLQGSRQ